MHNFCLWKCKTVNFGIGKRMMVSKSDYKSNKNLHWLLFWVMHHHTLSEYLLWEYCMLLSRFSFCFSILSMRCSRLLCLLVSSSNIKMFMLLSTFQISKLSDIFLAKNTKIQPYLHANFYTKKMQNVKCLYEI